MSSTYRANLEMADVKIVDIPLPGESPLDDEDNEKFHEINTPTQTNERLSTFNKFSKQRLAEKPPMQPSCSSRSRSKWLEDKIQGKLFKRGKNL